MQVRVQLCYLLEIRKKGSGCGESINCLDCMAIRVCIDFACNRPWDA